jgi:hypothetical protein
VVQGCVSFLRAFAVWVVGARRDAGQEDVSGGAQEDDVVEPGIELALVALTAGHEEAAGGMASEQVSHRLLAPYPVGRSIRQRYPVAPEVGIGIDGLMSSQAKELQSRRLAGP